MPRIYRKGPHQKHGPDLQTLTDDDLFVVAYGAPGMVETPAAWPTPWRASPSIGYEARRILRHERGHDDVPV
jgi:hypothetical protein